ncbi:uncharacterized protein LOC111023871 [Momordica charantia]|uniref:Uncharacterized protein LOC111023871 n=1 Tax=Momordica charantia TaxID=3673 RepID=A0A6J1DWU8_MOMCH|nr:uncharacterized protein LOC111023871 [Momordica charantia]
MEALKQIPNYVRFLKEILLKKKKQGEYETVAMTKACSPILTSKIPAKMKDPETFTILLGIGEARPITVTLQLADRSSTHPEGKIDDVLEVSIILGRPFIATGRALVDVHKRELTMRVQDQEVKFSVYDSIKFSIESEECKVLKILDEALMEKLEEEAIL